MNKTYVTDVQKFCQWYSDVILEKERIRQAIADAIEQLEIMEKERKKLKPTKFRTGLWKKRKPKVY